MQNDALLVKMYHRQVLDDVFDRCKGTIMECIGQHIDPAALGMFPEIDELVENFRKDVERLERVERT